MLQIHQRGTFYCLAGKRVAAVGKITFVRGNRHQNKCGNIGAEASKTLFKIKKIKMESAKTHVKCNLF